MEYRRERGQRPNPISCLLSFLCRANEKGDGYSTASCASTADGREGSRYGDPWWRSSQHVISTLYLDVAARSDLHQLSVKPAGLRPSRTVLRDRLRFPSTQPSGMFWIYYSLWKSKNKLSCRKWRKDRCGSGSSVCFDISFYYFVIRISEEKKDNTCHDRRQCSRIACLWPHRSATSRCIPLTTQSHFGRMRCSSWPFPKRHAVRG
jgi:hypothetical protein